MNTVQRKKTYLIKEYKGNPWLWGYIPNRENMVPIIMIKTLLVRAERTQPLKDALALLIRTLDDTWRSGFDATGRIALAKVEDEARELLHSFYVPPKFTDQADARVLVTDANREMGLPEDGDYGDQ